MGISRIVRAAAYTSTSIATGLRRHGTIAVLLLGFFCGQPSAAGSTSAVTLSPLKEMAGAISAKPGEDITLAAVKKLDDQGMSGQQVDWAVAGPGRATLTPNSSMTTAQSTTSDAGVASTVFHASAPGRYVVTATSQKNPGCAGASCATYISTRYNLDVADGAPTTSDSGDDHHPVEVAAAVAIGAAIAIAASNGGHHEQAAVLRTLAIAGGDNQTTAANTAPAQPLLVHAANNGASAASVAIQWSASGGATLSSPLSFTDGSGVAGIRVTSVGPGPGPVVVTATRSDDSSATVHFTINVVVPSLRIVSGDGQSAFTSTQVPNPLVVEALLGTSPQSGVPIVWSITGGDATVTSVSNGGNTDGSGQSSAIITFGPTPGPVNVTATRNDGSGLSQTFHLTSILTRTLSIVSGDDQSGPPNAALPQPLVVHAQTNNANASGVTINWSASGGATLSAPTSVTDGAGLASITVTNTGSSLGPIIVTATRADDPTASVMFTENIFPPNLSVVSGDAQSGLIGTAASNPLQVKLVDGANVPISGQTISWIVMSGSAILSSSSSVTDGAGLSSITFTYGPTAGPIVIKASAYGGTQSVNFNETAVTANSLTKVTGDAQTGAPGTTLPIALKVQITPPSGVTVLSGVPITFTVISGTASVTVGSTVTDALGQASTMVNLGLTPGAVSILAQVSGGGPSATFTETISGSLVATSLAIVSGNQQVLTPGTASAPMVVELTQSGVPLPGQTIQWAASGGSLANASSVTDANGRASTTVTISASGPITVTASFNAVAQYTASSVTFNHNSTLGSLTGLTGNGTSVAVALDSACAALSALTTRTPEQQDLLNQCLALSASSGVNSGAVTTAVGALLPSVSETQNKAVQAAIDAQFNNLKGRIVSLRSGAASGFGGLTFSNSSGVLPLGLAANSVLGLSADKGDSKKEVGADFSRWGFFASGNIGRGTGSAQADSPGFKIDVKGLTIGVDYRQSASVIVGAALGYTRQDTNLNGGGGSVNMRGFSFSGYSTWYHDNSWYLDGVVTFSHNNFDHNRHIFFTLPLPGGGSTTVNQQAKASAGGNDSAATLTFGRDFQKQAWSFGVYGRGEYSRQTFAGFTEKLDASHSGSGLGLRVESRGTTSIGSVLGGKVTYAHSASWGVVVPHLDLEWQHQYRGNPDTFHVFFVDDPNGTPIAITGTATDSNYFRLGFGSSFVFPKGKSGFVLYEKILGRSGITQDTFSLGFRMEF